MIGWDNFVLQTSLLNYNLCSLYDHSHLMHCVICWILLSIFLLNVQCPPYDFWKWSSKWEGYHEVVQCWERPRGYVCPVCDWVHQVRWQDQTIIVARHPCDCWHVHHGLSCLFPIYMVTHAFLHFFPVILNCYEYSRWHAESSQCRTSSPQGRPRCWFHVAQDWEITRQNASM